MDEKVAKWIIEFLLRKPIDEKVINGVLSCLPLSKDDNRLKKTILLRKIESETSNGSVSEKLLELLEVIEELNHREGKKASDLMKKAYCAVAVDCTVRFLEENVEENGKYFEAVERVWRARVCMVEGLSSEDLNRWLGDIEAAIWDLSVCEKILKMNTRNEALKAVRAYLKEAWKSMGPTFLELVALNVGDEVEELDRGGDGGVGVDSENSCREVVSSEGMQKGQASVRRKHIAVKTRRPRGAKISDAGEEDGEEFNNNIVNDDLTHNMSKVQEALQSNSLQLHAAGSDSHLDSSQVVHNLPYTKVTDNMSNVIIVENETGPPVTHATPEVRRVEEALQSNSLQLHAAGSDSHLDSSQEVHNLPYTKVTNNMRNVIIMENLSGPHVTHATPEVRRVQEALISSSRELHEAVTDPLPEALEIAKNLSTTGNHDTTAVENQNMGNDAVLADQTQPVIHAPREPTEITGDAQDNEIHDPKEQRKRKRKRSMMELNGTSHTLEWDDSIDNVSRGLPPSPKRSRVIPLEPYEEKKISVRERKKWTPHEEDTLRDAVKKFGRNWKFILECYNDIFKDRTNVDLKDKWRNMIRSQP